MKLGIVSLVRRFLHGESEIGKKLAFSLFYAARATIYCYILSVGRDAHAQSTQVTAKHPGSGEERFSR